MPEPHDEPDSLDRDLTQAHSRVEQQSQADSLDDGQTAGGTGISSSDISRFDEGWEQTPEIKDLETRYQVADAIGHGGMGEVYKAVDNRLKRPVAIKRLKGDLSQNKRAVERFSTEAEAVARLNHYNIVQIYDVGRDDQGHYIVMELVDGDSLASRLKQSGAIQLDAAIDMAAQLCDALAYAHQQGIVHRDIKPANILLAPGDVPKLTDFGLARLENHDHSQTRAGAVLGTIDFMPPEQHRDAHSADAKSDQWALAATLYQMITGESPRVIRSKRLPEQIREVVLQALEDEPEKRFESCQAFRDQLLSAVTGDSSSEDALIEHEPGFCVQCKRLNRPEMTFCESCGSSLTTPCPKCEQTVGVWASFCGNCGTDLANELEDQLSKLKQLKTEILSLRRSYQHAKAIEHLEAVTAMSHPAFVEQKAWAEKLLPQYRKELSRLEKQRDEIVEAASQRLNGHDIEGALQLLERVPASISNARITALCKLAESRKEELQSLGDQIRTAIAAKQFEGLKTQVEQFLVLRPHDEKARKLLKQLVNKEKRGTEERQNADSVTTGKPPQQESVEQPENLPEIGVPSDSIYFRPTPRKKTGSPVVKPLIAIAITLSLALGFYFIIRDGQDQEPAVVAGANPRINENNDQRSNFQEQNSPSQNTKLPSMSSPSTPQATAVTDADPANNEPEQPRSRSNAPIPASGNPSPSNTIPTPPSNNSASTDADGWIELFNGRDLSGWNVGFDKVTKHKTDRRWGFDVATQTITSTGDDFDYLISDQRFTNYTLDLQWRFPQAAQKGNGSGIIVHSNGSEAEFDPAGLEIDLQTQEINDILKFRKQAKTSGGLGMFGTGCILTYGFSASNHSGSANGWIGEENRRHLDWLSTPQLNQLTDWNRMTVIAINGRLLIYINQFLVNDVWGLSSSSGKIILRSQKAPVEFRSVRIKTHDTEKACQEILLQGKWQSVGQETGRMPWTAEQVRTAGKTVAFDGNQFIFRYQHAGSQVIEKGTYRINPTWSPSHIDMTGEYGNDPGSKFDFSGIYNFREQKLLHCFVKSHLDPTRPRPARFEGLDEREFSATYERDLSTPLKIPLPPKNPNYNRRASLTQPVAPTASSATSTPRSAVANSNAAEPKVVIPRELNGGNIDTSPWVSPDGRTIYWLREGSKSTPSRIWTAQRLSPELSFNNLKPLMEGRLLTLTDDELEIIFIQQTTGHLCTASRKSRDHSFNAATRIRELANFSQPKSPQLAFDGRTLLFSGRSPESLNSAFAKNKIWVCNRSSREAPWSRPRILSLHSSVDTPAWPSLSADGSTLFLVNGAGRESLLMMGERKNLNSGFTNTFKNVAVDQRLIYGRAPRYIKSTRELWYTTCPDLQLNQWELRVIRNFTLP